MENLKKIIAVICFLLCSSFVVEAQNETYRSGCLPQVIKEEPCYTHKFEKMVSLPGYDNCKLLADVIISYCNGRMYLNIQSFAFMEGCDEIKDKLLSSDFYLYSEFGKWFERNLFYSVAIALFKENVELYPQLRQFCPDGDFLYTGMIGQCTAYEYYKGWKHPYCFFCDCPTRSRMRKLDCSGMPCCEVTIKICRDKDKGDIKVTEVISPIPGQCDNSRPYSLPPAPFEWGPLDHTTKCFQSCSNNYPYGANDPSKGGK